VHEILSVGALRTQATRSPMKRCEEGSRLPLEFLAEPPIAQHELRGHSLLAPVQRRTAPLHLLCELVSPFTYSPLTTIWPRMSTWIVQAVRGHARRQAFLEVSLLLGEQRDDEAMKIAGAKLAETAKDLARPTVTHMVCSPLLLCGSAGRFLHRDESLHVSRGWVYRGALPRPFNERWGRLFALGRSEWAPVATFSHGCDGARREAVQPYLKP